MRPQRCLIVTTIGNDQFGIGTAWFVLLKLILLDPKLYTKVLRI